MSDAEKSGRQAVMWAVVRPEQDNETHSASWISGGEVAPGPREINAWIKGNTASCPDSASPEADRVVYYIFFWSYTLSPAIG